MACMFTSSSIRPCNRTDDADTNAGRARILSIINASKQTSDDLHLVLDLENKLVDNPSLSLPCHKGCVSTYVSSDHISRVLKRHQPRSTSEPPSRRRRSDLDTNFDFKKHCIFCGHLCLPKDPRNPKRWKTVIQCRTADRGKAKSFKQSILDKCNSLDDRVSAEHIKVRISGAITDLHAADAQYHKTCYDAFQQGKKIKQACIPRQQEGHAFHASSSTSSTVTSPLEYIFDLIQKTPARIWTTVELYNIYESNGGDLSRRCLIDKICSHFGDTLLLMHIKGCASLLGFRDAVSKNITLIEGDDDDNTAVENVVSRVKNEVNDLNKCRDYDLGAYSMDTCIRSTSPTLLNMVSQLVSGGKVDRKSLSLAQSLQQHIQKVPNQTTLGLAVKLHHKYGSKELITCLNQHGYIATYQEVSTFRKSAALYTAEQGVKTQGLVDNGGPIYCWFDNYDLNVYTPNGCRETHAVAIEFTQHPPSNVNTSQESDTLSPDAVIPRLSRHQIDSVDLSDKAAVKLQHYHGPKRPLPPPVADKHQGQPFEDVRANSFSLDKALSLDSQWLHEIIRGDRDNEPSIEWSGYMSKQARVTGDDAQPATKYVLGPLIDHPPSHPDTVLTTMTYCEQVTRDMGMEHVVMCADMQLFKVVSQIKWANPERWNNLIILPGAMHTLMSFLGCVGTLMKGSGLEEILNSAYKGVGGMLNGKAWPKALRGLRMVTSAILGPFVSEQDMSYNELQDLMENSRESPTGRLWVDCLITPTIISHLFIRSQREGDYLLHLYCLEQMLCYFFAAGHWQYARYISWHVFEMRNALPDEVHAKLRKDSNVCRHRAGVWNAVAQDQFGEQTYIRYGKAKGGLVGLTLSAKQVAEWMLSYHICQRICISLDQMFTDGEEVSEPTMGPHKEEGRRRMALDAEDRHKIKTELDKYPNPLTTDCKQLFNIVNGKVAGPETNVHESVEIGQKAAAAFRNRMVTNFHAPLKNQVKTMETLKKGMNVGQHVLYDLQAIYARLLVVSQHRNVTLKDVFHYELCPVPPALFDEYMDMRKGSKATLLHKLAVFTPVSEAPEVEIIDGNALLYHVVWPQAGTVETLANSISNKVHSDHDIIIVFDKYLELSTKEHERQRRGTTIAPAHHLQANTPLPTRDTMMRNSENKKQLIQLLSECNMGQHVQVIGQDDVIQHEEADVTMITYVLQHITLGAKVIMVRADDTDVFVLLVHWFWRTKPEVTLYMAFFDNRIISINETVNSLGDKCSQLLAVHALTGCDTTSFVFGKGKSLAARILQKHNFHTLDDVFGEEGATCADILDAGRPFFAALYGEYDSTSSMNDLRHTVFCRKKDKAPDIRTLPPTDDNLVFHLRRAHYQVMLWKAADQDRPPVIDPTEHGWRLDGGVLRPVTSTAPPAPMALMQVISCGCQSETACASGRCSCHQSKISCTQYCGCGAAERCRNIFTLQDDEDSELDEVTDEYEEDGDRV